MIHIGHSFGFQGYHQQPAAPQTAQTAQTTAAPAYTTTLAYAAPVYPVALMPAYMMAQPAFGASVPNAEFTQPGQGGHVTTNPTNSQYNGGGNYAAGGGGFAAGGFVGGFGMPVLMSPVMLQFGYPVAYGGTPPATTPPSTEPGNPVVVDVPVDDPAPVEPPASSTPPSAVPPASVDDPVDDTQPPATGLPSLPITQVPAEDFQRYRFVDVEKRAEYNIDFSLTTLEGDVISLSFNQLDIQERSGVRGVTVDGERVRGSDFTESTERLVNIEVDGSLSAEEQAAVDAVMNAVVEAVQNFFNGDTRGAVAKLKAMDFDLSQLGELSLSLRSSRSAELTRGYLSPQQGQDQLNKEADVLQALDFLASEQKRLVDVANDLFDTPSSTRLIKSLLPPLLSAPFSQLDAEIDAAQEIADTVPTTDDDDDEDSD